jgi:nitric oxide reductase NorD protein
MTTGRTAGERPEIRALWLESHLLGDPEGAAAHETACSLGPDVHAVLLRDGDRLALISPLLAQSYYRRAADAWRVLGRDGFDTWVALGEGLAAGEPACREGAIAYFAVPPAGFAAGVATAREWCRLGRRIAAVSAKLGSLYFKTSAGVLQRPDALDRLPPWTAVAVELHRQHGWQGEFLAQAYLGAAPVGLCVLKPEVYRLWAGTGAALYPSVREKDFFGRLPRALRTWPAEHQIVFFRIALRLARSQPRQAYGLYRDLPGALRRIPVAERGKALAVLRAASQQAAAAVGEIAPVLGALLGRVPRVVREAALDHVGTLGSGHPEAVVPALRSLPRIYEEAAAEQVEAWFETGASVADGNRDAGLAYFALESRTSLKVLSAASTAVSLEECQGLLRKYVQMLSGEPVSIRSIDKAGLRPPIEEFPDENEVALPYRIADLPTCEENLRVFRFLAAQLAGRRQFGTYVYRPPGESPEPDVPAGHLLWRHLNGSPESELLEALFLLAEGYRIQARLSGVYKGLAGEGQWVATRLMERWRRAPAGDRAERLDALFAITLLDDLPADLPPWLPAEVALLIRRSTEVLAAPGATVEDAMRVAELLTESLRRHAAVSRRGDAGHGAIVLDQSSAGALFDPYLEDDGVTPGPPAPLGPETDGRPAAEVLEGQRIEVDPDVEDGAGGSRSLSADELKRLLEAGARLGISEGAGSDVESVGLYITDLIGKVPAEQIEALERLLGNPEEGTRRSPKRWLDGPRDGASFSYDEWDYHIGDYRSRWCRLREISLDGDSGEFFNQTLAEYSRLIPEVRRQFQRVRPEMYRVVRGLEDGEDFDLNAAIDARVDARAGRAASSKLYVARKREERDVATLFLVDMSASTDEALAAEDSAGADVRNASVPRTRPGRPRRIIDVTKETLVVMAGALEEIGDAYAIYGFSGHGRENVEVYRIKSFSESLSVTVKGRLGGIEPKRSTRMGTALRHAVEKLAAVSSRSKHLFLLSDGFPQDYDYGQDRRSNLYGIRDTAVALSEAESAGVTSFCITVDKAGHDYLRQMCDESRYMVIEDIAALPRELPKIYQRIVRA